jgi:hypothetical protein
MDGGGHDQHTTVKGIIPRPCGEVVLTTPKGKSPGAGEVAALRKLQCPPQLQKVAMTENVW